MENKPPYKKVFTFLGGTIGFLLLCSLIYFIADPDLLSLFILFGIGAFAGFVMTCLFIFYAFFYRWARVGLLILLGIIGIVLLSVFWRDITFAYDNWYSEATLPKVYKHYKTLGEESLQIKGVSIEKVNLDERFADKEIIFFNKNNELIYYNGGYHTFRKYSPNGKFIDNFMLKTKEEEDKKEGFFLGDFFINKYNNYSLSWAIDGDTIPKSIPFLKESYHWDSIQRVNFFKNIRKTADYYTIEGVNRLPDASDSLNIEDYRGKVFFAQGGKWAYFYLPIEYSYDFFDLYRDDTIAKGKPVNPLKNLKKHPIYKKELLTRECIHPKYISANEKDLYWNLVVNGVSFPLKETGWYYDRNTFKDSHTTYLKNEEEMMEVYQDFELYSNRKLHYKLLLVNNKLYMVR